jgi:hypothetical protein
MEQIEGGTASTSGRRRPGGCGGAPTLAHVGDGSLSTYKPQAMEVLPVQRRPRVGEEGATETCVGGGRSHWDLMELGHQPGTIRPAGSMRNRQQGWRLAPCWLP